MQESAQKKLPENIEVGPRTVMRGPRMFARFKSTLERALVVGSDGTMENVHFALGPNARMRIGDYCYFTNAIMLVEQEVTIGSYVMLGWNVTIADTDFHPIDPAQRIADAVALSPLGNLADRPPIKAAPVRIDDDVWVGPNATILKGVHIGAGSRVEPGAVVTQSVPPNSRVVGNPARVAGSAAP